jgi:hypothetical protein
MLGIGIMSLAAVILSAGKGDLNAMLLVRRGAFMYPFIQNRYAVSGKYNKIITVIVVLALALNNFLTTILAYKYPIINQITSSSQTISNMQRGVYMNLSQQLDASSVGITTSDLTESISGVICNATQICSTDKSATGYTINEQAVAAIKSNITVCTEYNQQWCIMNGTNSYINGLVINGVDWTVPINGAWDNYSQYGYAENVTTPHAIDVLNNAIQIYTGVSGGSPINFVSAALMIPNMAQLMSNIEMAIDYYMIQYNYINSSQIVMLVTNYNIKQYQMPNTSVMTNLDSIYFATGSCALVLQTCSLTPNVSNCNAPRQYYSTSEYVYQRFWLEGGVAYQDECYLGVDGNMTWITSANITATAYTINVEPQNVAQYSTYEMTQVSYPNTSVPADYVYQIGVALTASNTTFANGQVGASSGMMPNAKYVTGTVLLSDNYTLPQQLFTFEAQGGVNINMTYIQVQPALLVNVSFVITIVILNILAIMITIYAIVNWRVRCFSTPIEIVIAATAQKKGASLDAKVNLAMISDRHKHITLASNGQKIVASDGIESEDNIPLSSKGYY